MQPRRRHATTRGTPDPVLTSTTEVSARLAALDPSAEPVDDLRIELETLDLLRVVTLVDADVLVCGLEVVVRQWVRPHPRWTGSSRRIPYLRSCTVTYPGGTEQAARPPVAPSADTGEQVARVAVRLAKPVPLAEVARGVYSLLGVDRGLQGSGFPEVATVGARPTALALLPSRTALGVPRLPNGQLDGLGLSRGDLGLVGDESTYDSLLATRDDPALTLVRDPYLVTADGHLDLSDRVQRPLLDLNVHNPVNRLLAFQPPSRTASVRLLAEGLAFEVRSVEDGSQTSWVSPLSVPLTARDVQRLTEVEHLDLAGLDPHDATDVGALCRRLAELAATGVVLHSLPRVPAEAEDLLGPLLLGLLQDDYRASTGLARELRSVPQRREAMTRFGGFFELARHAGARGHRLLPTVSLVLSSTRPARVREVLRALAAQSYPHVELVVGLHGVSRAADPELEACARECGATLVEYDATTVFGSVLADLARRSTGDLVAKVDDDDVYGPRVVEDLVLAQLYSNADLVGKTTEYLYLEDVDHTVHRAFATERYHYQAAGGAMLLSRATLDAIGGWRPTPNSTDRSVLIRLGVEGGIGYRTQSLGYVYVRHSEGHTWKQADSLLVRNSREQWPRFMTEIIDA